MTNKEFADAWETRVNAVGGTLSTIEYNAAINLWTKILRIGLDSDIIDMGYLGGSNLAAAKCKMIVAPSTASSLSDINSNIVSGDYDTTLGISLPSNTNKGLGTGVIPSAQGLSNTNICIYVYRTDDIFSGDNQNLMGVNNTSGACELKIGGYLSGMGTTTARTVTRKHVGTAISLNGLSYDTYSDVVKQRFETATTPSAALNTEVTLFKSKDSGADVWGVGAISFYFISKGLDEFKYKRLHTFIREFHEDTTRKPNVDDCVCLGDSIFYRESATTVANTMSRKIAVFRGLVEANLGIFGNTISFFNLTSLRTVLMRKTDLKYYRIGSKYPNGELHIEVVVNDCTNDPGTNGTQANADKYRDDLKQVLYYAINVLGMKKERIRVWLIGFNTTNNATKCAMWQASGQAAADAFGVIAVPLYAVDTIANMVDGVHPDGSGHNNRFNAVAATY